MDDLEHRLINALHAEADTVHPHGAAWNGRPPPARRGWPTWLAIAAAVAAVVVGATFAVARHGRTPEAAGPPVQGNMTASPTGSAGRHPCDGAWAAPGMAVITGSGQSTAPGTTAVLRFAGDTTGSATLCALISSVDGTTLASGSADQAVAGLGYLAMITGQQTYLVGAFNGAGTTITIAPGAAPGSRGESGRVIATTSTPGVLDLAPPSRALDAHQPAWADKGAELIAQQKAHPPVGVANSKPFAYQSDHFDLVGDGMYDVVFHVPASFTLTPPADGRAIGLGFAMPDDRQCRLLPGGAPSLVKTSTGYDLHYPFAASGVSFAYPDFSIWIY